MSTKAGQIHRKIGLGIPSGCSGYEEFRERMSMYERSFLDAMRVL